MTRVLDAANTESGTLPSAATTREDEAKWSIDSEADYARFLDVVRDLGGKLSGPRQLDITDHYLDSEEHYLVRAKCRCRLRSLGHEWYLTFKESQVAEGATLSRREKNVALPGVRSERAALAYCSRHIFSRIAPELKVQTLFSLHNQRESRTLRFASGLHVESSFDRIEFRNGHKRWSSMELELEMIRGTIDAFVALVEELTRRTGFLPQPSSKYDRAAKWCGIKHPRLVTPQNSFSASGSLARAAHRIIGTELRRMVVSEPSVRVGVYSDAIHDMRVACRKIRCAAQTFSPLYPADAGALVDEVTWLGRTLGSGRDLEVHTACLRDVVASMTVRDQELLEAFCCRLEDRFEEERDEILGILESKRYSEILVGLERLARSASGVRTTKDEVVADALPRIVRNALARIERVCPGGELPVDASDDRLHRLRIRLKRIRYLCEFFEHAAPPELSLLLEHTKAVQKSLGLHQDYRVGRNMVIEQIHEESAQQTVAALRRLQRRVEEHKQAHRDAFIDAWPAYWRMAQRLAGTLVAARRH